MLLFVYCDGDKKKSSTSLLYLEFEIKWIITFGVDLDPWNLFLIFVYSSKLFTLMLLNNYPKLCEEFLKHLLKGQIKVESSLFNEINENMTGYS